MGAGFCSGSRGWRLRKGDADCPSADGAVRGRRRHSARCRVSGGPGHAARAAGCGEQSSASKPARARVAGRALCYGAGAVGCARPAPASSARARARAAGCRGRPAASPRPWPGSVRLRPHAGSKERRHLRPGGMHEPLLWRCVQPAWTSFAFENCFVLPRQVKLGRSW